MNKIKYVFPILLMLSLVSCEDFFRSYVPVDPPPYEKRLVVNMYVVDEDTVIRAGISRNTGSLDGVEKTALLVNDAMVVIKDSRGDVVCQLDTVGTVPGDTSFYGVPEAEMINYRAVLPAAFGGNGETFTLEVSQPRLGMVTARQTMPAKPDISRPLYKSHAGVDMDGNPYDRISFILYDPPGEENFYRIKVMYYDQSGYFSYVDPGSDDPLYVRSYDWYALLLEDKTFDGEDFPVGLNFYNRNVMDDEQGDYIPPPDTLPGKFFVVIESVSKDLYLYDRSLARAEEMGDVGFFAEPVQVYNNIEGGLGIFGMSAVTRALAGKED